MLYRLCFVSSVVLVACWAVPPASHPPRESCTSPPAPPAADVRGFGAVGDGKTDDTEAIQRAIDSGIGAVRLPAGVYRISRPLVIDLDRIGPVCVAGEGTARIVMAGPGPGLKLIGTHQGTASPDTVRPNVWLRQRMPLVDGLEILGAHEQAVGIQATGTMQLTVTRVNIRETLHAIHLTQRNRNVIVSDCHLYKNRGVGLYLDDVNLHQINVTGSHVSYNAGGGIVARGGNVRNLQLTGCDIEGNMSARGPATANVLIDCTGGSAGTAEVAISGCTIQHTHNASGSANIRFLGRDRGGRTWGHLTIANNVLSDVQINVDVRHARGVILLGNTFWKGVQQNLRIMDSSNVLIGPNLMDRNPNYQQPEPANEGVLLRRCGDVTIHGLHVSGVRRAAAGLVLEDCRRINVTGCTVLDCENAGILLSNVSGGRLSDCLVEHRQPAEHWQPLIVSGGGQNLIAEDLLGPQEGVDR